MIRWHQGLSTLLLAGLISLSTVPSHTQAQSAGQSVITGDQLDPTKWSQIHSVEENDNGEWAVEFAARSSNQRKLKAIRATPPNPRQPQSYSADVIVNEAKNNSARVRVYIQGRFYKDEALADAVGDIVGNMDIRQQSDGTNLQVFASVHRCQDPRCGTATTLFEETLGTVSAGTRHRLSMRFDGNNTFTFNRDDNVQVSFNQAPAVIAAPSTNGGIRWWYIGASVWGVDPVADPVEEGLIRARFDNITVNGEIIQDFNDLESNEARSGTEVRRVEDGKAVLKRFFTNNRSTTASRNVTLTLLKPADIDNSVSGDVTISDLELNDGTVADSDTLKGSISMAKRWYQSTPTDTGGGDVFSELKLVYDAAADGTISDGRVELLVGRCVDAKCGNLSLQENLFPTTQSTFGAVEFNTEHTMSTRWDGNAITFGFDDQQQTFNVTEQAPIVHEHSLLVSEPRIFDAKISGIPAGASASITAQVDNVTIDDEPFDDFATLTAPPTRKLETSGRNTNLVSGVGTIVEPDL